MFSLGNRASGKYGLVQGWRRSIGGKSIPVGRWIAMRGLCYFMAG